MYKHLETTTVRSTYIYIFRSQVAHEEWWMLWRYYHERRRDLIHDWKRDRLELLNRVKVQSHMLIRRKGLKCQTVSQKFYS